MVMFALASWHLISPNGREEILDEGGKVIADPFCVLRGIIRARQTVRADDGTFNTYSPAISGRVEKVIIIPDHNEVPGIGGTFDIEAFQHYIEAPIINALDVPVQETLDILDGQGLAVVDNAITHLTKFDAPYVAPVRTGILPHILIQDKLKFAFQRWADAEDYEYKSIYVDLYLTK